MKAEAKPRSRALRWLGCFLLVCAALFGLALFGMWLLRNVMLTQVLDEELRARGVTCDALLISSTSLMGEITLAPTSCALAEPTISRIRWREPLSLTLSGMQITRVATTHLEVTRTARPTDARAQAWGSVGSVLHGPEQVGAVLIFASQMSRVDATPAFEVGQLAVQVEGAQAPEMTLTNVRVAQRNQGPVEAQVQTITLAAIAGPLGTSMQPSVSDVTLHAEPTTGQLAGELDAGARLPLLGAVAMRRRIQIVGAELDQPIPHWSMQ